MKKFLSILLALAMVLGLGVTTFAANYTTINGQTTTLKKYLVVDADAEIPAAEFTFTVSTPASDLAGTATEPGVKKGPNPELVKINSTAQRGTVTFTAGEAATTANGQTALGDDYVDEKAAVKDITVDFSGVTFSEPGIYRYYITESDPTAPVQAVGEKVTTLDVYVEDRNGTLTWASVVAYDGTVNTQPKKLATAGDISEWLAANPEPVVADYADEDAFNTAHDTWVTNRDAQQATADAAAAAQTPNGAEASTPKDDKFVNKVDSQNLTVKKTVTGNQGSRDQFFEFTVTIANAGAGTVLTLDMSGAENGVTHENTATTYTKAVMDAANTIDDDTNKAGQQIICDSNGGKTFKLYLHHGEEAVIKGLPVGATYTVVETESGQNGYTTTGEVNTATAIADEDVTVNVVNNKNGVLPTGLASTIVPGIALVAIAGVVIFMVAKKKKATE